MPLTPQVLACVQQLGVEVVSGMCILRPARWLLLQCALGESKRLLALPGSTRHRICAAACHDQPVPIADGCAADEAGGGHAAAGVAAQGLER